MGTYFKNNPLDKKSFKSDIERYSSICVFAFAYAKLKVPSTRSSLNLSTTAIPTRFILDVEDLCQGLLDWSQKLSSILNSNLETEDTKLKNCDLASTKLEICFKVTMMLVFF